MLQLRKAVLRGIAAHYLKIAGQVLNGARAGRADSGIHGAKRDFGGRLLTGGQQVLGALHAQTCHSPGRSLSIGSLEQAQRMKTAQTGFTGDFLQRQGRIEVGPDEMAMDSMSASTDDFASR
jgi:hypothetical protein